MTAQEFIKQYGWDLAKLYANGWITFNSGCVENDVSHDDLKQLVDAWGLVESYGGLDEAGFHVYVETMDDCYFNDDLKQAIELVESVK